MSLSPSEAAESLKEIEQTGQRSTSAYWYTQSSRSFTVWGVLWVFAYSGTDILWWTGHPNFIWLLWLALAFVGSWAEMLYLRHRYYEGRSEAELKRAREIGRRSGACVLIVYAFIFATFAVLKPRTPVGVGAFIPLVVATYYALLGVWKGARYLLAGAGLAVLTLGGYFLLPNYFLLWMAVVGGGSLILVGQWMKRL